MSRRARRAALLLAVLVMATAAGAASRAQEGSTPGRDAVVPFKIQVPDAVLADLKERLARTRFPTRFPVPGGTTAPT